MEYRGLRVGQKIKIRERAEKLANGRVTYRTVVYRIAALYPDVCLAVDGNGFKRGLSKGDLIINGVIRQSRELEAVRKQPDSRSYSRKGGF